MSRGLNRATTTNSWWRNKEAEEGRGGIFQNLLYYFSNVTVLKSFISHSISWPQRFLRKFFSSILCQSLLTPHPFPLFSFLLPRIIRISFVFFPFLFFIPLFLVSFSFRKEKVLDLILNSPFNAQLKRVIVRKVQ